MTLTTFLQQCLTGISLGGAYALIAIGYTLVYGILRLINFAHGDIFMMAGYFMIFAMASLPWFIAIPVTLIVTVVLGVTIERVAYRPLRSSPRMSVMISAIGVSYLLQNLATYLFTALPKTVLRPAVNSNESGPALAASAKSLLILSPDRAKISL